MDRRELLVATGGICSTIAIAGCLDGDETSEPDFEDNSESGDGSSEPTVDTGSKDDDEEECFTELETKTEEVLNRSRNIDGGYEWTHGYRCEDGDTVHFDISASSGQDIEVEIDSPQGQTIYSENGLSLTTSHRFDVGGSGEVRITNLGDRTNEERELLWDDREDVGAGGQLSPWVELREADRVDYRIRMVDGARPKLRIEDASGTVLRDHSVSEVIDDEFTAPEDGRYYFYVENTAMLTTGTWDYTFERVEEIPISTTVDLTVEREYEEEVEICN